ncbi:hypothetical protein [Paludibaculum fermentans]|uniref:hypothetical protein n=1 Tax=Paludibaculum fermentans TaxID=1473598 RepID=UPI003EB98C3B
MQIKAIKPFLGSVEGLIDNGQVFDADDARAKELIGIGLVEPYNPVEETKVVKPVKEKKSK